MLQTSGYNPDIPSILDVVDLEIAVLIRVDVLDGNYLLVNNVTSNLWSRIITNKNPLRFEEIWINKIITKKGTPLCTSVNVH